MQYDIIKLYEEIKKVEQELDKAVENDEEYNKIYEKSIVTDRVIAKFLDAQKQLENERRILMEKYEKELNAEFKDEIIAMIRQDVKEKYPNVGNRELEHFSNNVYVLTTLQAHKTDKQEIVEQLLFLNNRYVEDAEENGQILKSNIDKTNLSFLKHLSSKYTKIIEERI